MSSNVDDCTESDFNSLTEFLMKETSDKLSLIHISEPTRPY